MARERSSAIVVLPAGPVQSRSQEQQDYCQADDDRQRHEINHAFSVGSPPLPAPALLLDLDVLLTPVHVAATDTMGP